MALLYIPASHRTSYVKALGFPPHDEPVTPPKAHTVPPSTPEPNP